MIEYAWLIPVFPAISFVILILFGKHIGQRIKNGEAYVVISFVFMSLLLSIFTFIDFMNGTGLENGVYERSMHWIEFGDGAHLELGILVDNVSALLILLVSFLVTIIAVYSFGYMSHDDGKPRYYAEFSLFAVGMMGAVLSNNFLQLLIFWEIMGLCSYLLIGFWYRKPEAAAAAKKAFLVTRIGDVMFLIGVFIIFTNFGTLNFTEVGELAGGISVGTLTLAGLMLFGGTIGKSAQFPLHVWLPDAMEGPTTVSALIHAATMVKAGIFLLARSFPIIIHTPDLLIFIAFIGAFTAFLAATMALVAKDIKKVLAYSTISQLGYMVLGLGAGGYLVWMAMQQGDHVNSLGFSASLFHLMNHAFFKALLFLGAGSVIHGIGTQNMFKMGGLRRKMKFTFMTMSIACFSIAGIIPLSGFWSKDEILASTFDAGHGSIFFTAFYILAIITAFLTALYMFRLLFLTFFGEPRDKKSYDQAHESPKSMTIPLMILAVFAAGSGLMALLIGNGFFDFVYFEEPHHFSFVHMFESPLTYISLLVAVAGILLAYAIYYKRIISVDRLVTQGAGGKIYKLIENKYYMDDFYLAVANKVMGLARLSDKVDRKGIDGAVNGIAQGTVKLAGVSNRFDNKVIDGTVNGFAGSAMRGGRVLRRKQTGRIADYTTTIILGVVAILIIVMLLAYGGIA